MKHKKGTFVNIGGVPVDLNAGMIEAVTNPPLGFVSKHKFQSTDVYARVRKIDWFASCGSPLSVDLTMGIDSVDSWSDAMKECESDNWETATLEARNQLTIFLSKHHRDKYRNWNNISREHKDALVNTLVDDLIRPFQEQRGLSVSLVHSVQWNVLAALMELSYIEYNHQCFFFHELFMVYESGHLPCGWHGEWPNGSLVVY